MTSLLRDEVPVPIAPAASTTITAWPRCASARATASPTTPAPTTSTSIDKSTFLTAMAEFQRAPSTPAACGAASAIWIIGPRSRTPRGSGDHGLRLCHQCSAPDEDLTIHENVADRPYACRIK